MRKSENTMSKMLNQGIASQDGKHLGKGYPIHCLQKQELLQILKNKSNYLKKQIHRKTYMYLSLSLFLPIAILKGRKCQYVEQTDLKPSHFLYGPYASRSFLGPYFVWMESIGSGLTAHDRDQLQCSNTVCRPRHILFLLQLTA